MQQAWHAPASFVCSSDASDPLPVWSCPKTEHGGGCYKLCNAPKRQDAVSAAHAGRAVPAGKRMEKPHAARRQEHCHTMRRLHAVTKLPMHLSYVPSWHWPAMLPTANCKAARRQLQRAGHETLHDTHSGRDDAGSELTAYRGPVCPRSAPWPACKQPDQWLGRELAKCSMACVTACRAPSSTSCPSSSR